MKIVASFIDQVLLEAQQKTTHWGVGGAGIVFVCPEEQKVFLQKRSKNTHNGAGQWAFPGGGIHPSGNKERFWSVPIPVEYVLPDNGPVFYQQALVEVAEECGSVPPHKVIDSYLYEDRGFKYRTFVVAVSPDVKQNWNIHPRADHAWESEKMAWFTPEQFARVDLFFGFTPELLSKVRKAMVGRSVRVDPDI